MVVRVRDEPWKIGLKAVSWLHLLLFTKLTANEQILLCIRKRKLWFELPLILFYRFDFRNWDIKGRHWGGCCVVWSCFNFNLKHPKKKKICYIYKRRNTKYWQICFDPWKLSRSTKIFGWRKHCLTSPEKVWTRLHKFRKSQTWIEDRWKGHEVPTRFTKKGRHCEYGRGNRYCTSSNCEKWRLKSKSAGSWKNIYDEKFIPSNGIS